MRALTSSLLTSRLPSVLATPIKKTWGSPTSLVRRPLLHELYHGHEEPKTGVPTSPLGAPQGCAKTAALALRVVGLYVALEDLQEFGDDLLPAQGGEQGAILEYGGNWFLERPRQADPEVRVL